MKLINYIVALITILLLYSCSSKEDRLFSASDELHYVILYKTNYQFEILYNGLNTVKGEYSIKGDTIFLNYTENQVDNFNPNKELSRTILIDNENKKVKSIDNRKPFCANVDLDKRKE